MISTLRRVPSRTAVVLAVIAVLSILVPAGARAAGPASEDFTFLYFPHQGADVSFANDFGAGRSGGRRHQGNDIFSDKLTPVLAVADGFVERIGEGGRSGWHLMIRHAGGWETWYMHLNDDTPGTDDGRGGRVHAVALGIEEGSFVEAGQVIGWVGDSGNAEGAHPHTHFELHHDGRVINPYPYLEWAWERRLRLWDLAAAVA